MKTWKRKYEETLSAWKQAHACIERRDALLAAALWGKIRLLKRVDGQYSGLMTWIHEAPDGTIVIVRHCFDSACESFEISLADNLQDAAESYRTYQSAGFRRVGDALEAELEKRTAPAPVEPAQLEHCMNAEQMAEAIERNVRMAIWEVTR